MSDTVKRAITVETQTKANGTTTVVASTPNPDRYSDVVASDWKLDAYMENPVVQFGHRYDIPPVGRTENLTIDPTNGNLVATIKWDDNPTNPLAQTVASQYRNGFLRAVSVGFQPTEAVERARLPTEHPAHGAKGMYFTGNRLLEISAVPVPANAESLALRGFDMACHILDAEETDTGYVITYAKVEQAPPTVEDDAWSDEDDEDDEAMQMSPDETVNPGGPEEEKDFNDRVRSAVLDLLGHDDVVRSVLTPVLHDENTTEPPNGLGVLLGLDK